MIPALLVLTGLFCLRRGTDVFTAVADGARDGLSLLALFRSLTACFVTILIAPEKAPCRFADVPCSTSTRSISSVEIGIFSA